MPTENEDDPISSDDDTEDDTEDDEEDIKKCNTNKSSKSNHLLFYNFF